MLPKMVTKMVTCYQKWEQNGNMLPKMVTKW